METQFEPFSRRQYIRWVACVGLGLLLNYLLVGDYYDCGSGVGRWLGLLIVLGSGIAVYWAILCWLGDSESSAMTGAMWTVVPWSAGLSSMAYLGFLFLPLEMLGSAVILQRQSSLAMSRTFVLALTVRIGAQLALFVCRPLVITVNRVLM
jgi:hypothetical protein